MCTHKYGPKSIHWSSRCATLPLLERWLSLGERCAHKQISSWNDSGGSSSAAVQPRFFKSPQGHVWKGSDSWLAPCSWSLVSSCWERFLGLFWEGCGVAVSSLQRLLVSPATRGQWCLSPTNIHGSGEMLSASVSQLAELRL